MLFEEIQICKDIPIADLIQEMEQWCDNVFKLCDIKQITSIFIIKRSDQTYTKNNLKMIDICYYTEFNSKWVAFQ